MKRVQLQPAYLLSLRPYRECSALVEAFTGDHGRVGLVARGIRGAKSKQRGVLQPFGRLLLSWSDNGDLGTLSGAEAAGATARLHGEAIFSGWYLNELLLRLLPRRDPHPGLFERYAATLAGLAGHRAEAALRMFEKHLLDELGYGLNLPTEVDADAWYEFDAESGARALAGPTPAACRGASLRDLLQGEFRSEDSLRDAKRLLREALRPHLGGRDLATPRMLRSLRRASQAPGIAHA